MDCDWLAGLIDGLGGLYLSKSGGGCLEITTATADRPVLEYVRSTYGGSLKARAGNASVRYRAHNRVLLPLLHAINGRLRHGARRAQYERVAQRYGLHLRPQIPFSWHSGYFSGLFDSDGTIILSVKGTRRHEHTNTPKTDGKRQRLALATATQLTLSVTQKHAADVRFLNQWGHDRFGRAVYDRSQNGYTTWCVTAEPEVRQLLTYFGRYPCRSCRKHRVDHVIRYYALQHHTQSEQWRQFARDWFHYDTSGL
jgi:hypothetical protein